MIDMMATWMLKEEHHVILKVLTRMAVVADDLDRGKAVEPTALREFLEFFRVFVEQAHYQKEESALIAALEKNGVPTHGQPLVMLHNEHMKGRGLLTELATSVSAYLSTGGVSKESLASGLRRVAAFYASHMWTEDYWLLPVVNNWLSSTEQEALAKEFRRIEAEIGPNFHRRFEKMAEELDCAVRS